MKPLVLAAETVSAFFAVMFVVYYIRILSKAQEAGPEPTSWIISAVGVSLISSFGVLEFLLTLKPVDIVFNIQRVYFMLGNLILFAVFYRLWRNLGGKSGW